MLLVFLFAIIPFVLMRRLCGAIWLLLPLSSAIARSIRKAAGEQKPFSLQTDRSKPPWSNTTSRLHRRNPDAVSFHVDPNHNYAWTPIQLGGWSSHPLNPVAFY